MPDPPLMPDETHGAPKNTRRFLMMPAIVLGLLGGHVVFVLIAITIATGDRSFAVVPDYYQKAVAHDDRKAELSASAELGWQLELRPADSVDTTGHRGVVVLLRDHEGLPVTGAEVGVSAYHYARASEPIAFELTELLPGQYSGSAAVERAGFWQFELIATRGQQRFISEFKQFVNEAGGLR